MVKKRHNDSFAGDCKSKAGDWVYFGIFPGDLPINRETWQLWCIYMYICMYIYIYI